MTYTLQELKKHIADPAWEGRLYHEMAIVRSDMSETLFQLGDTHRAEDQAQVTARAVAATKAILGLILDGKDVRAGDPGHGVGHWTRDYMHSLYLTQDPRPYPWITLAGIIGGTLHDIGTLFLDRYADRGRAFRHAEAAALMVRAAGLECGLLDAWECELVAYAIAAHTHYPQSSVVICADGVARKVTPYEDVRNGRPDMTVWLTRWADRLDCSGPCMVGRHYLVQAKDHEDFDGKGFYKATFAEQMRTDGVKTFLAHMRMFASSQTNESPYGKWDAGVMVPIRDAYRASLERIIESVEKPKDVDVDAVLRTWSFFLGTRIEPTVDMETLTKLETNFRTLDPDTQRAWANGFHTTMFEYIEWAERMRTFLKTVPEEYRSFPGLSSGLLVFT